MPKNYRLDRRDNFKEGRHISVFRRETKSFPLHSHAYYEIEIILSGSGVQWINGNRYDISRGSVYILSPADFHEIEIHEKSEQWNIVFDETVLTEETVKRIYSITSPSVLLGESALMKADKVSSLLLQETQDGNLINPLIDYLLGISFSYENKSDYSPVRKSIKYIETYFKENPSLSDAARVACLTPEYFSTLFKKETGKTYTEYLNTCKVKCACMLLKSGVGTEECRKNSGFNSQSTFLYTFKKVTGVSPSAWKRTVIPKKGLPQ